MHDANELYDPETSSSSGLSHVPSQPMSSLSPRGLIRRDSCLQPDTRNSLGITGHVFEGVPARGEPSSALFGKSKNLASSSCRLKPIDTGEIVEQREGLRKGPQDCTIPRLGTLCFVHDARWDQALLFASEIPKENVVESLCKMRTRQSVQVQTVLAMYEREFGRD